MGLFIVFYRVRFFNFANLDCINNTIFICNHRSYVDPILISIPLPYIPIFIARQTLLKNALLANILMAFENLIFIPRDNFSVGAFKTIIDKLKNTRKAALLYPEGTRSLENKISEFKRGFAIIANLLHRDINLFYIKNSHFIFGRRRILSNLFTSMSIYYLKKISYNTNPSLLCREVNKYYREFERKSG